MTAPNVTTLLAALAENPRAHADMSAAERDALCNLKAGLAAAKRDPQRAPRADGALYTGDRPAGGTKFGWTEGP